MVKLYYFKNQRFSKLKAQCERDQRLFVDPEFPPETKSLFFSRATPPEPVDWKRPKDICAPDPPQLFVDGMSSHDVTQGKLGNCWFVAACSSLAMEPSLLEKVIPEMKHQDWDPQNVGNYQGIFRFRFYRQGQWTEVVVDDLLPTIGGKLVYVHSTERNEFWSALIEKAYAKLAGSYEALEAGNTGDALVDFTGGVCESINLKDGGYGQDGEKRLGLFKSMERATREKSLISASIRIKNRDEMEKRTETGLVMGHAYGVTSIKKITIGDGLFSLFNRQQLYMIRLRNPWGQKEWNGPWSDDSEEWKKLKASDREKLGIVFENDGEFWMAFEDFCTFFTNATVCHVLSKSIFSLRKRWHVFKHNYQWTPGTNAGGCVENRSTFLKNPQYAFSVEEEGEVMISLMQEDTRKEKERGVENLTIGYFVMKVEENRKYRVHTMFEKAGDSIFINAREVVNKLELKKGRYLVVPSTYEPEKAGRFLIRVFTEKSSNAMFLDKEHSTGSKIWCCFPQCRTPVCVISVTVKSATGLQKTSRLSMTPDPYALISCEGRKVRTPVIKDSLVPQWNTGALFFVRRPQKAQLVIQVWDSNWFVDSFMGQAKLSIDINDKAVVETHNLMGRWRSEEVKMPGSVTVEVKCYQDLFAI